jgi:hypothetical protein
MAVDGRIQVAKGLLARLGTVTHRDLHVVLSRILLRRRGGKIGAAPSLCISVWQVRLCQSQPGSPVSSRLAGQVAAHRYKIQVVFRDVFTEASSWLRESAASSESRILERTSAQRLDSGAVASDGDSSTHKLPCGPHGP